MKIFAGLRSLWTIPRSWIKMRPSRSWQIMNKGLNAPNFKFDLFSLKSTMCVRFRNSFARSACVCLLFLRDWRRWWRVEWQNSILIQMQVTVEFGPGLSLSCWQGTRSGRELEELEETVLVSEFFWACWSLETLSSKFKKDDVSFGYSLFFCEL